MRISVRWYRLAAVDFRRSRKSRHLAYADVMEADVPEVANVRPVVSWAPPERAIFHAEGRFLVPLEANRSTVWPEDADQEEAADDGDFDGWYDDLSGRFGGPTRIDAYPLGERINERTRAKAEALARSLVWCDGRIWRTVPEPVARVVRNFDGRPFALEAVDGEDFAARLRRGVVPPALRDRPPSGERLRPDLGARSRGGRRSREAAGCRRCRRRGRGPPRRLSEVGLMDRAPRSRLAGGYSLRADVARRRAGSFRDSARRELRGTVGDEGPCDLRSDGADDVMP
jgi:hypothetical protein